MNIKLIVALTESGNTARLISKYRPEADILAITFDELTQKSLMLNWGVIPVVTEYLHLLMICLKLLSVLLLNQVL